MSSGSTCSGGWDGEELGFVAALAGLPKLNPGRLDWLLELDERPSRVWERLLRNRIPGSRMLPDGTKRAWRRHAETTRPADVLERCRRAGVQVVARGSAGYPPRLADDPEAPAVLFCIGDLSLLERPTAAIVGTRRASGYGRDAARLLGRRLAAEGVVVVSGLAAGIDVAAQRGALSAGATPVVGVAGTGLDVVYPPESSDVWRAAREGGVLLSEAPMGYAPSRWRFPDRNRIMAGLADVVVVVESPQRGGSLITVDHALRRDVPIMAVPGPITSSASAGTNRLLADGCGLVCDPDDVLLELGIRPRTRGSRRPSDAGGSRRPEPQEPDRSVLEALDLTPTPFERVLERTGMPPLDLATVLYRLEAAGWARSGPGWWERLVR